MQIKTPSKKEGVHESKCYFAIDVGSDICGCAIILHGKLLVGFNVNNYSLLDKVREFLTNEHLIVLIEDIRPYSGRLSMDTISTIQFIGELRYRLANELQVHYKLITRGQVKKWVFEAFPDLCIDRIDKKIAYLDDYGEKKGKKRYRNKDGGLRKASFHYVDDRVVIAAMKRLWNIPEPRPFRSNKYGLISHAWQALAVGSYYLHNSER